MRIIKKYFFILLLSFFIAECSYDSGRVKYMDANIMILVATSYREQKCQTRSPYNLLMIKNPTEYAVDACTFTLFREPCTADFYPPICLELYDFDIPFIGPDLKEFPKDSSWNIFERMTSQNRK